MDFLKQALQKSQELEAQVAYMRPCSSRKQLKEFTATVSELAGDAAQKGIKLCVENTPGRALPTARETLSFVEEIKHPNLYLLLDVGHTLLSKEKPWEIVRAAGDRLGYIHLNDNDGRRDRHWPLLEGRLTSQDLGRILDALKQVGYSGTLALELKGDLASIISGLSRNRNLLMRIQEPAEPRSLKEPEERRKM